MKASLTSNPFCLFSYSNSILVSPEENSQLDCYKGKCELQKKKPCFKKILAQVKRLAQGGQEYITKRRLSESDGLIWVVEIKNFGVPMGIKFLGPRHGKVMSMLPCTTVITVAKSKDTREENEKLIRNLCRLQPRGRYFRFYGQCHNLYSARERSCCQQKDGLDFKMNRSSFVIKVPTTPEVIPLADEIVRYIFRDVFRQKQGDGKVV